jgi:hypothetical protein
MRCPRVDNAPRDVQVRFGVAVVENESGFVKSPRGSHADHQQSERDGNVFEAIRIQ